MTRSQITGRDVVEQALRERIDVQLLMIRADDESAQSQQLIEEASARGVRIWRCSPGDMRRLGRGEGSADAIALVGPSPQAGLGELLERGGISWLLHDIAYPSNVGYAVRTAEVSGADGVIIHADFNHEQRNRIASVSMGASRLLPVLFHETAEVLDAAAERGVRCVALEDVGDRAPWDVDLCAPLLCLIGGERGGLPQAILDRCHAVLRIPMAGFVPSYNVQAAMAAIATERLRQLGARRA